jgi:hypothetical protein
MIRVAQHRAGWTVFLGWLALTSFAPTARAVLVVGAGEELRGSFTVSDDVVNQGSATGLGPAERLVFGPGYRLSGNGSLAYTLSLGTYAPGNSPAITTGANQQFGGVVQIELGGLTPGFGNNNHDQINDAGTVDLLPSSTLSVLPWNGFVPPIGSAYTIITWQTSLTGSFGSVAFDPFFASNNRFFQVNVINPTGAGSIVLQEITGIPEAGAWLLMGALATGLGAAGAIKSRFA